MNAEFAEVWLLYKRVNSVEELTKAWKSGLDFKIVGGPICSIRDFKELKKMFDNIRIVGYNFECTATFTSCIWENPLRGITRYI